MAVCMGGLLKVTAPFADAVDLAQNLYCVDVGYTVSARQ